ncbi:MAG: YebC/PmpR family DNA-binding transcriptional regulator [Candidatus Saccharimonadales bacterium]
MSGHSKWHSIKHKKGAADAKRGKEFTKLGNTIAIAAREGADPEINFRLRLAIDKARAANMPNANIEKAIARGSGQLEGEQIQEITYEGYGPSGIAVIVEVATDNKNRAYSDVKAVFSKHGGNMGEPGSVAYQFDRRGIVVVATEEVGKDEATLAAIDAGAIDVEEGEDIITVYTDPKELAKVTKTLGEDFKIQSSELGYVPQNTIMLEDKSTAQKAINLLSALEELDDVASTYSNFDIADDIEI